MSDLPVGRCIWRMYYLIVKLMILKIETNFVVICYFVQMSKVKEIMALSY